MRAALKGVELEAAARWRGVGRSAVPEGGEEAVSRRDAFALFEKTLCSAALKQLSVVSARRARTT